MQSDNGTEKVWKKIFTELKKEIAEKPQSGICVTDLALEYNTAKSTISATLKN